MELNDAVRRIFVRHTRLIICCVLLPLLAVAALAVRSGREYTATARIQAAAVDPDSDTQADAVLNRAQGVITSPDVVQAALDQAGVRSDSTRFAEKQVGVSRLGSSTVVTITVTDRSPDLAAGVSRALAYEAVHFINDKRESVPATSTTTGGAYVIYTPDHAQPVPFTHTTADLALALIGGLLAGLLAAAAIEVVRPTVPGAAAFGRELGIPVLGSVGPDRRHRIWRRRREQSVTSRFELLAGLRRAAERADVLVVALIGPVPVKRLQAFAVELDPHLPSDDEMHVYTQSRNGSSTGRPPVVTTLASIANARLLPKCVGLVVVVPNFAPQDALSRVRNLAAATGWPLLGALSAKSQTAISEEEPEWISTSFPPVPMSSGKNSTTTRT
jgi:capsular polysaccharide biosynthesis protein